MRAILILTAIVLAAPAVVSVAGTALSQNVLPNPVKTCRDVRAYIGSGNSMTMDTFKKLLTASGLDLDARGQQALDNQCKAAAVVKNVTMSQHILTTSDGKEIRATTRLVDDKGVCKLTNVSLSGC